MKKLLLLTLLVAGISSQAFAQKEIKHLPEDLDKSKIVFIEFTVRPPQEKPKQNDFVSRMMYKQSVGLSENLPISNQQLKKEAPKYPFGYEIIKRSQLEEYKSKGFKYALDCEFYQLLDMGAVYGAAPKSRTYTDLYLIDLQTNDKYIFDEINNMQQLAYGSVIKSFIRKVKRAYHVD